VRIYHQRKQSIETKSNQMWYRQLTMNEIPPK
jgi:hypothetical protein